MTTEIWKEATGRKIREQREELGIKQEELAAAVGVSDATISNWEMGKTMLGALSERRINAFFRSKRKPSEGTAR